MYQYVVEPSGPTLEVGPILISTTRVNDPSRPAPDCTVHFRTFDPAQLLYSRMARRKTLWLAFLRWMVALVALAHLLLATLTRGR